MGFNITPLVPINKNENYVLSQDKTELVFVKDDKVFHKINRNCEVVFFETGVLVKENHILPEVNDNKIKYCDFYFYENNGIMLKATGFNKFEELSKKMGQAKAFVVCKDGIWINHNDVRTGKNVKTFSAYLGEIKKKISGKNI